MVRQARSEATRRKIINAAVDLFGEVGYSKTSFGDVIQRVEMTKGALYHHFDSKESLALAIIGEAAQMILARFRQIAESSSPALENMIHGVLFVADLLCTDKLARTGTDLLRMFASFNQPAAGVYAEWLRGVVALTKRAQVEGDLRADLDAAIVGEAIASALVGAEFISIAQSAGADMATRLIHIWEVLLPAIVSEESLPYFNEFLARESMRHVPPTTSVE